MVVLRFFKSFNSKIPGRQGKTFSTKCYAYFLGFRGNDIYMLPFYNGCLSDLYLAILGANL